MPRPNSSTPQLLLTVTRSFTPVARTASINTEGRPQSPNPPTAKDDPLVMSATASAALATTLSIFTTFLNCRDDIVSNDRSVSRTNFRRRARWKQSGDHFVNGDRIAFSHKDIHGPIARSDEYVFHLHGRHHDQRLTLAHVVT